MVLLFEFGFPARRASLSSDNSYYKSSIVVLKSGCIILNLQGFLSKSKSWSPVQKNVTSSDHVRCTNDTKEEARVDRALEPVDDQKKSSS